MPPSIALLLWLILVLGLLCFDPARDSRTSLALWVPITWMFIIASRLPSQWLGGGQIQMASQALEEGNALDRTVFAILIFLALGILLFLELSFFIPAVLGSLTLYILMRPRMHYLTVVRKWSRARAAWLLMILSFLIILLPFGILANLLASKLIYAVEHSNEILDSLKTFSQEMKSRFGFAIADETTINEIGPFIRRIIPFLSWC